MHGHRRRLQTGANTFERDFDVELPNAPWVTDITYVLTHEGWLYLAAILDLF